MLIVDLKGSIQKLVSSNSFAGSDPWNSSSFRAHCRHPVQCLEEHGGDDSPQVAEELLLQGHQSSGGARHWWSSGAVGLGLVLP